MTCNREPGDLFERTVLNRILVKASLVIADLEASRQVGASQVLFFSISNLVFNYSEETYSVIYMIYSYDNS